MTSVLSSHAKLIGEDPCSPFDAKTGYLPLQAVAFDAME